jgi:hypothetical protein
MALIAAPRLAAAAGTTAIAASERWPPAEADGGSGEAKSGFIFPIPLW